MSTEGFQGQLEAVYQEYQHSELEDRLEDIAETMEETILQLVLAEEFLQTEVQIDETSRQAVRDAKKLLDDNEYDGLENMIDDLETTVEDQERKVNNHIHEVRIGMSTKMHGMRRLNERVERVDETKLDAIADLLDDWNWKEQVYRENDDDIETLKEYARSYGSDMRRFYEEAKEDLFGPYNGTPLEPIVDDLLDDERFSLAELSDEELDLLRDSDLDEYVELSLS